MTNSAFGDTVQPQEEKGEIHSNSSGMEAPVWSIVAKEALDTGLHSTRGEKWVVAMETPNMPFAEEYEMCIAETILLAVSCQPNPKQGGRLKQMIHQKPKVCKFKVKRVFHHVYE